MDILMTRYILEIMQDIDLFKLYGNGWYPNIDDYGKFVHKQEKNNENFAKTVKRYNLVKPNDVLYETVPSGIIDNVTNFFDNEKIVLKLGYGNVVVSSKLILDCISYKNFYISNGVYNDTYDICNNIIKYRGGFAVGVCDNPESVFYQENKARLKVIEGLLKKKKLPYLICKHNNHRDKSYIISYRGSK